MIKRIRRKRRRPSKHLKKYRKCTFINSRINFREEPEEPQILTIEEIMAQDKKKMQKEKELKKKKQKEEYEKMMKPIIDLL